MRVQNPYEIEDATTAINRGATRVIGDVTLSKIEDGKLQQLSCDADESAADAGVVVGGGDDFTATAWRLHFMSARGASPFDARLSPLGIEICVVGPQTTVTSAGFAAPSANARHTSR